MAITTYIDEQYGSSPGTEQQNVSNLNVGNQESYEIVVATYPIKVEEHAYEKWIDMRFTGTANQVSNYKTWISGGSLHANADMDTNCNESSMSDQAYVTPIKTISTLATNPYPESEPSGSNISNGGTLGAAISSFPNNTDYIIFQYQTYTGHPIGAITQLTLTFQWDEQ